MNFDDTPQEAAFRAEARAWIEANAPKELHEELSQPTVGRIRLRNHDISRGLQGLAEKEGRGRLGLSALAEGIWRPRRIADRA
ncbi:MAG: hypothetical protein ACTHM8_03840, partial [Sphingomonas sp.]